MLIFTDRAAIRSEGPFFGLKIWGNLMSYQHIGVRIPGGQPAFQPVFIRASALQPKQTK